MTADELVKAIIIGGTALGIGSAGGAIVGGGSVGQEAQLWAGEALALQAQHYNALLTESRRRECKPDPE